MKNKLVKEYEIYENRYKGIYNGEESFLCATENFADRIKSNKNLKCNAVETSEGVGTLISCSISPLFNFIDIVLKEVEDIHSIVLLINLFIDKGINSINWIKLRGDYAEAYFLHKFGGNKIPNDQKFDVKLKDKYIEIKSYSSSKNTVTIKNSQIVPDVVIVGLSIRLGEGKNILELASLIDDSNFSEELKQKYSADNGGELDFFVDEMVNLEPKPQLLDDAVIDAAITFDVKRIKKGEYE